MAILSTFIREEGRVRLSVYYTSRVLKGAEERYPPMEKLAFALITAAYKVRPYFQAHTIVIQTNKPLRKTMNHPEVAKHLVLRAIQLSEFDIQYRLRTTIKG